MANGHAVMLMNRQIGLSHDHLRRATWMMQPVHVQTSPQTRYHFKMLIVQSSNNGPRQSAGLFLSFGFAGAAAGGVSVFASGVGFWLGRLALLALGM